MSWVEKIQKINNRGGAKGGGGGGWGTIIRDSRAPIDIRIFTISVIPTTIAVSVALTFTM